MVNKKLGYDCLLRNIVLLINISAVYLTQLISSRRYVNIISLLRFLNIIIANVVIVFRYFHK